MNRQMWSYKGCREVQVTDDLLSEVYQNPEHNPYNLLENEYLIVKDGLQRADVLKWQDGKMKKVIVKPIESDLDGKIKPKNPEQECFMDILADNTTTVKMATGTFGSGKTYLGLLSSMKAIQEGKYNKLVYVRNTIEVKDSNPIGHLKGSYMDKMSVWCGPLADILGGLDQVEEYVNRGLIDVQHLGFIRGRSFKNSILYTTEAEHFTRKHVQLLLGRVAEGSILILEGDYRQMDAKAFEQDNGMLAAVNHLKGNRLFSYIHLNESVRSETAKLADLLDERT